MLLQKLDNVLYQYVPSVGWVFYGDFHRKIDKHILKKLNTYEKQQAIEELTSQRINVRIITSDGSARVKIDCPNPLYQQLLIDCGAEVWLCYQRSQNFWRHTKDLGGTLKVDKNCFKKFKSILESPYSLYRCRTHLGLIKLVIPLEGNEIQGWKGTTVTLFEKVVRTTSNYIPKKNKKGGIKLVS